MALSYNPNSRVQVVDAPVAHPGFCALCGSPGGDGRKFIDTQWSPEEFYGVVYYCTYCFSEIANQVGYQTTDQVMDTQRRLVETENRLREVLDECANLRIAVDALAASGYSVPDDGEDGVEDSVEHTGGESGTDEPVDESGSSDLSKAPDLDLSEFDL